MSNGKDKLPIGANDKDLDDLLNNALKDFEKSDEKKTDDAPLEDSTQATELWNDEFFEEQAKLLSDRMNSIFGGASSNPAQSGEDINLGFQKMAEAAAAALQGNVGTDEAGQKYAESITQTLKGLKDGVDNLQAPVSETDVVNMFSGLSLGEGEGSDSNPFLPFMQGMMQSLLSSEILLPSIKELLEKYPKYLEENGDKINPADKERYIKQQELFVVICKDLESEKADDSSEIKQGRFKRVLDNMQKLHEYGQPPEDLIGEVGSGLPGLDGAPGNGQCPLM